MAHDEQLTTKDDGGVWRLVRPSSFFLRRVVIVLLAGVSLGLFLSRFWYELDPVRFAAFGVVSAGTLFGCAAMSGEVGLLPPTAWFAAVFAAMAGVAIASFRAGRPRPGAI